MKAFRGAWWWYGLFGRIIGYGYLWWPPLLLSLLVIAFSAVLFKVGDLRGMITPTNEGAYYASGPPVIRQNYPKFNSLTYSLETFLPLVKLQMADYWAPNANLGTKIIEFKFGILRLGGLLRFWLWIHTILGWVLTSLWVGRLTGLIKT